MYISIGITYVLSELTVHCYLHIHVSVLSAQIHVLGLMRNSIYVCMPTGLTVLYMIYDYYAGNFYGVTFTALLLG